MRLKKEAMKAKEALSIDKEYHVSVSDLEGDDSLRMTLTRKEFEDMSNKVFNKIT